MQTTAITGKIKEGELMPTASLSLFPDGTEVIILSRADWNIIAGSDSTQSRLAQAENILQEIQENPEQAGRILEEQYGKD